MKKNLTLGILATLWVFLIVFTNIKAKKAEGEANELKQQIEECQASKK